MRVLKHLFNNPFIAATGAAALAHSTWALGTLFAGIEPAQFTAAWVAWLIPALLIAFALDVGQIATSAEIREGQHSRAKYATFMIFAVATYYLQWLYISHHMPRVSLGAGVRDEWSGAASLFRDLAVWIIPALLPLSTTLYTLSGGKEQSQAAVPVQSAPMPAPIRDPRIVVVNLDQPVEQSRTHVERIDESETAQLSAGEGIRATCPFCGWVGSRLYEDETKSRQALIAHSRHCKAIKPAESEVANDQATV